MATPAPTTGPSAETTQPAAGADTPSEPAGAGAVQQPRVVIQFCTQCKWMLRAAYFAQELLSTFGTALGEVALQPATGGVFRVTIESVTAAAAAATPLLLWDRKTHGGFPETKELKRRVRDVIEPGRDLGHVDRVTAAPPVSSAPAPAPVSAPVPVPVSAPEASATKDKGAGGEAVCEDCQ